MKPILQKHSPVLRKKAETVSREDIGSAHLAKILDEMKKALDSQDDGVAIAAPQIGYALRIFIVSEKVAGIIKKKKQKKLKNKPIIDSEIEEEKEEDEPFLEHTIFINPTLKKLSKEKMLVEEGCLSVRYLYGKVKRSIKATVEACDADGKKFTQGASGLLAQIFQHEVDHLNGVLFIDKAIDVEEMKPEESR